MTDGLKAVADVEASVFDGAGTVAEFVARPATLVMVVGVVAESPGLAPLAILSDVSFDVRDSADGKYSVDNPVVFPADTYLPN